MRVVATVVAALASAGCAASDEPEGTRAPCEIANIEVRPERVAPGDAITVSSSGFLCDYELDGELRVGVALFENPSSPGVSRPPESAERVAVALGEVAVVRDGSFSAQLRVPSSTEAGTAEIYLTPETVDLSGPCDETSGCPLIGGTAALTVT